VTSRNLFQDQAPQAACFFTAWSTDRLVLQNLFTIL